MGKFRVFIFGLTFLCVGILLVKNSQAATLYKISPEPNFGNVFLNLPILRTFQISRALTTGLSIQEITITDLDITGDNAGDFDISDRGDCIGTVDSCQLTITFKPSSVGEKTATLHIIGNSGIGATQKFTQEIELLGAGSLLKSDRVFDSIRRDIPIQPIPTPAQPTPTSPPDSPTPEPTPQPTAEPTPQQPAPELPPSPTDQVDPGDERTLQGGGRSVFSCSLIEEKNEGSLWRLFLREMVKIK